MAEGLEPGAMGKPAARFTGVHVIPSGEVVNQTPLFPEPLKKIAMLLLKSTVPGLVPGMKLIPAALTTEDGENWIVETESMMSGACEVILVPLLSC
jgi:hypothetical protein